MRRLTEILRGISCSLVTMSCCVTALAQGGNAKERIIILNEGLWQSDNARVSYFEDGRVVSNKWFEEANGYGIGDTPNDIIQVGADLIAIAVNGSNIIQYMNTDGTAVATTEDVPNNRKMATDGEYLYVTSYAHECSTADGLWQCTKGFVAKIDLKTFKVVKCCEVGYEPEGIAWYGGCLFVANTGGYSYQEDHDYESTVSVIDAVTMTKIRDIDTGVINLYGKMSQTGKYLCINSCGDYYLYPACSLILDCSKAIAGNDKSFIVLDDVTATYNCATPDGTFFALGSAFDYITYESVVSTTLIDPEVLFRSGGREGLSGSLPGTVSQDISSLLSSPYGIYVNPYTGYIYATNSDYVSPGTLYQWTPDGTFVGSYTLYLNPAHFLALGDWTPTGVAPVADFHNSATYNLQGIRALPDSDGIVITNGRKHLGGNIDYGR